MESVSYLVESEEELEEEALEEEESSVNVRLFFINRTTLDL